MDLGITLLFVGLASAMTAFLCGKHIHGREQEEDNARIDCSFLGSLTRQSIAVIIKRDPKEFRFQFEIAFMELSDGIFASIQHIPEQRFPSCFTVRDEDLRKLSVEVYPLLILRRWVHWDTNRRTGRSFVDCTLLLRDGKIHRASIQAGPHEQEHDLSKRVLRWVYDTHFKEMDTAK
jgi:hypothetical protein